MDVRNANVEAIGAEAAKTQPTEVALGMADRATMQAGIDKLTARGVKEIVAVPLFVSSHSTPMARIAPRLHASQLAQ